MTMSVPFVPPDSSRIYVSATRIFEESSFLRAITAPLIKYAIGSPEGPFLTHSTFAPSMKPISAAFCALNHSLGGCISLHFALLRGSSICFRSLYFAPCNLV
jgi:hypothetical protein